MKYMLLIYGARPETPQTPAEIETEMNQYWGYEKEIAEAGIRLGSEALQPVETATMVAVGDDGTRTVTDGPFAETREILGGYYLLDVPDLDAALEWAAKCPGSWHGNRIEVRPVIEFEEP